MESIETLSDTSLKGMTREMMNIVEDISEKKQMSENNYLKMMNLLMKVYKKEETPTLHRGLYSPLRSSPATIVALMQITTHWPDIF